MTHFRLAVLLGMTVALGPFALDTYLPAFPRIAENLAVPHAQIGLTLSAYVAILGLGQLVGGPLSDRYGRRYVLLGGLALFCLASFMISFATSLSELMVWRVVQGLGGAFCAVSVPAIVRDRTSGTESARLFSLIGLIMFIAPALAPAIGALLLMVADWPSIFVLLAVYAAGLGILLHFTLFRHAPPAGRSRTPVWTLVTNYAWVLRHGAAMRFIAIQALAFSTMLVFITHSSFIYQEWFGRSEAMFAVLFALNIVGMASANLLNRRLLLSYSPPAILRAGVLVQATAMLILTGATLFFAPPLALVAALIVIGAACMGAVAPNSIACALEYFPRLGGTAAAVLGATQFTLAGVISTASTLVADGTLIPIVLTMAICSVVSAILALSAPRAARMAARRMKAEEMDA